MQLNNGILCHFVWILWWFITVHTLLSCEIFWHKYAKIPIHTSPNSIAAGNLEWILATLLRTERTVTLINDFRKKFTKNILTIKETQVIIPYIKIFVQRADNGVWERIPLFALFCVLRRFLLLFTHHYPARCFGMNMPKSRDIHAKILLPQAIWNEFWLRYCERSEQ